MEGWGDGHALTPSPPLPPHFYPEIFRLLFIIISSNCHACVILLLFQGVGQYSKSIKSVEEDMQKILKNVNELTGTCQKTREGFINVSLVLSI